ncbi:MAG: SGNH/GDSL hydrolase family protein [Pseudolabrys sp.]
MPVASIKASSVRVVFFGDSICVGQGVSLYRGWVTRVAGRLDELAAGWGREIIVTNASVNGSTTRQALERMPYDVQSHGADILIVQFGLNDCNYWLTDKGLPRVSPEGFAANLKEMVRRGVKFGARTVFLHNNHPTTRDSQKFPHSDVTYDASNRQYNAIVREVARGLGPAVNFIDIEAEFDRFAGGQRDRLASLLLPDGLHLSAAGHALYFDLVCDKIVGAAKAIVSQGLGQGFGEG